MGLARRRAYNQLKYEALVAVLDDTDAELCNVWLVYVIGVLQQGVYDEGTTAWGQGIWHYKLWHITKVMTPAFSPGGALGQLPVGGVHQSDSVINLWCHDVHIKGYQNCVDLRVTLMNESQGPDHQLPTVQ